VSKGEDPNIKVRRPFAFLLFERKGAWTYLARIANLQMESHIASGCVAPKVGTATGQVTYKHACSHTGCKKRELVPFVCKTCKKNYCVSHRLDKDHTCVRNQGVLEAAERRSNNGSSAPAKTNNATQQQPARQAAQQPASRPANPPASVQKPKGSVLERNDRLELER
jgi:hypothetical protein